MSDRIVIVGGGRPLPGSAGATARQAVTTRVTMLSAEAHLPYNRPPLSKGLLRGTIEPDAVFVESATAYEELAVDLRLGASSATVDPEPGRSGSPAA